MAKDPAMPGPVSALEGGAYESSEEVRARDSGLTRSEIINKFGEAFGRALLDAGYASFTSLRMASDEELLAISGVGPAKVTQIREAVGKQEAPADEQELPDLGPLAEGDPDERYVESNVLTASSTAVDTSPRFGEEGSPRFGEEGAVSPRVARIRAAEEKKAKSEAGARAFQAGILQDIQDAGGMIEVEIEVEEVEEPEPDTLAVDEEGDAPVEPEETEPQEAPEVEEERETVEITPDDVGELGGELLDSILEEAEEEEAPSE